ncbi:uncharacterized protein LOC124937350 [Impatiens glandulifera]|uniref:uncharacterized protein LOC124937350 n=1 Tax=Impatiens glandulifera TaxID=253017 RepID=UPI001FB055C9|nr:uncharacterized protein LOC124937350 [Impatiens glandulifera]
MNACRLCFIFIPSYIKHNKEASSMSCIADTNYLSESSKGIEEASQVNIAAGSYILCGESSKQHLASLVELGDDTDRCVSFLGFSSSRQVQGERRTRNSFGFRLLRLDFSYHLDRQIVFMVFVLTRQSVQIVGAITGNQSLASP